MDNYVPFLKLKSNEIIALSELDDDVVGSVTPFFDFPKQPKENRSIDKFVADVVRLSRSIKKHLSDINEIYVDTYDLDDEYQIDGKHGYFYLIGSLTNAGVIPVVSIDRSEDHIQAVIDLNDEGVVSDDAVALRLTPEDFLSYNVVAGEIEDLLEDVLEGFKKVDLIFDCRVCTALDVDQISQNISNFHRLFSNDYSVRRTIITGSSIPASIGEILNVNSECEVLRKEIDLYRRAVQFSENNEFIFGDYTTVSPNYSDVDVMPEMMQNIMTAKLTYSYGEKHFFIRGGGIRTNGYAQYFDLAEKLCAKSFFRGADYSTGDEYFDQKSRSEGSNCMPGTIIKPSVNAHMTYILRGLAIH